MYAIIRTGGKQAKVRAGDVIDVERLRAEDEVTFTPLLVVAEDGTVISGRDELAEAKVVAKVLGPSAGPKIDIFKYKAKTGYRRRQGHRQKYTRIEVTDIELPGGKAAKPKGAKAEAKPEAKKAEAEAKPEVKKAEAKPEVKKAEAKPEAKKAEAKPEAKEAKEAEAKPEAKKAEAKPEAKEAKKAEAKPEAAPAEAPEDETTAAGEPAAEAEEE